ncbi:MAG: arginine--tRNA ligase [Pseudonocardia sp.]
MVEVQTRITDLRVVHDSKQWPSLAEYPLPALKRRISGALGKALSQPDLEPQFDIIERERFGGDIAIKFPQLLRRGGPKVFTQDYASLIVSRLSQDDFADAVADVSAAGMYVNVTLTDAWFDQSIAAVINTPKFGQNDSMQASVIVVDYSSPNVAKKLHAGHIRSTIVGHVLANLYEAVGALVYRVNHVNDFGGFGYLLEGWHRFASSFPSGLSVNERLLEIYGARRTLERLVNRLEPSDMSKEDRRILDRYFPNVNTVEQLADEFTTFVQNSDERFARLEAGCAEEVALWQELVVASLKDFESFYEALNISFDFVLGESFYYQIGTEIVDAALADGRARTFDVTDVGDESSRLDALVADGSMSDEERTNLLAGAEKDVGAVVIPLGGSKRFIVRRADGRSIYATRDLGAVKVRHEVFGATDIVYVVGQEQRVHFERLFQAVYAVGIADQESLRFKHVYFGFYVDAKTGKKLSSRDSVSGVSQLLNASLEHFHRTISERSPQSGDEAARTAKALAVGSLVFNDLKKDIRSPVEIDSSNIRATVENFEKAGGAYVAYAAVRARSVVRRAAGLAPKAAGATERGDAQESFILLKVQQIPEIIAAAAVRAEASLLIRHLQDLASEYNSYYARVPVIANGEVNIRRLKITDAVQHALRVGLSFCHVETPEWM